MTDNLILNQIPQGKVRVTWSNGKTENVTYAELERRAELSKVRSKKIKKSKNAKSVVGMERR